MPNLILTANSKFRPFSYQELVAPVMAATQAHREVEDAYADLADSAEEWGNKIDPSTKAYTKYRDFMNSLEEQADVLAKQGLTPSSRQQMLKIRSRYSKDINPIKVAYERGRELADEQRKLYIADPTLRFDNDFSISRIDDLIANPNMSYAGISGRDIAARASAMYGQYAKTIMQDPDLSRKILGNQKYLMMQQQGYTPEQILADIMGSEDAPPELRAIRESIHNSLKDHSAYNRDWVDQYISQGAHSGIGTRIFTPIENEEYISAVQRASLARQDRQLALSAAQSGYTWDGNNWVFNEEALKKRYKAMGKIKGDNEGSKNARIPGYDEVVKVTDGERVKGKEDGKSVIEGRAITIGTDGGKYTLKAGNTVLATYTPGVNGKGDKLEVKNLSDDDLSAVKEYFGTSWNAKTNENTLKLLMNDIVNMKRKSGNNISALNNYNFYYKPDDKWTWGSNAAYYIEPLSREMETVNDRMGSITFNPDN